jgi:hypothetical protein
MAVDFNSKWFKSLPKDQQKAIVLQEFKKCKEDFKYFVDNYAYIRHPSAGILKVKFFDFQYDVCIPISIALKYGRTQRTYEELSKYKPHYDYDKHMKFLMEHYLDTYKKIPAEFHDFYRTTIKHPDYWYYVDTILLKSRQTGLSTALQQLINWHINFYPSVYDLVLSQGDREAKKFVADIQRSYELIPGYLRAEKVKMNDHELWLTLSGKDVISGVQALPPTPKAGRGYSPNLVVLDEFAFWKKPEETYTAISMALSGGGIMVIISTPNGVGNLYHKLWEMSKKEFSVYVEKKSDSDSSKSGNLPKAKPGIFRPVVVHWSQLPIEEFKRRGFDNPIDWYWFMANKLMVEGGERKVAQELDLDFITSGESLIPHDVLKQLKSQTLESDQSIKITKSNHIEGLTIYEEPKPDSLYILGVDVSEGVGKDYSVIYVLKVLSNGEHIVPQVVAKYSNNRIPPKEFAQVIKTIGELYNNALINFEKNNPGLVVYTELIDHKLYDPILIMNRYNPTSGKFVKGEKGWRTTRSSKPYMLSILKSFVITYKDNLKLPVSLLDEFLTFYEPSYHDDEVMAYGLAIVAHQLLDKYREFLIESKQYTNQITTTELDDIPPAISSQFTGLVNELEKEFKTVKADKVIDTPTADLIRMELKSAKSDSDESTDENSSNGKEHRYRNLFGRLLTKEVAYESDEFVF